MSKKHFIMIARILNCAINQECWDKNTIMYIAGQLAIYFSQDNQLFDEDKFKKAVLKPYQQ